MDTTDAFLHRLFYSLASLVLVAAILYWAQVVLVPLALAILLAFLLNGPMLWLEHRRVPRALSLPAVALVAFALLGLFGWVTAAQVRQLAEDLPGYEDTVKEKLAPLQNLFERAQTLENLSRTATEKQRERASQPRPALQPTSHLLLAWIPQLVRPLLDILAHILLVVVLTVFILARREALRDRFLRLVGHRHLVSTTRALDEAATRISRYLLLQATTNCCVGLGVGVGLGLLGIPYAALWGLLAAALRFLPYVGIWVAALLPLLLSVAIFPGWLPAFGVVAVFLGIELVMANVIEPLLFGHGTGVSPIALLVVAVFWAWLWGAVGLLLSTPMTVCLVVMGRNIPALRFLNVLLGDIPPVEPPMRFFQRLLAADEDEAALLLEEQLHKDPPELVYDQLLIPTLVHVRQGREEQRVTEREEQAILLSLRSTLDNLASPAITPASNSNGTSPRSIRVIGCPTHGEENELALEMLGQLLRRRGHHFEIVAPSRLATASIVPDGSGVVFCVAALPPGGLSQALVLCRRARALLHEALLLVGRWGDNAEGAELGKRLRNAGADLVSSRLLDTLQQIDASAAHPPGPAGVAAPEKSAQSR